ncbi:MAG: hypothetical protein ACRDSR_23825 [Pseudonocardiaceae bacterium]
MSRAELAARQAALVAALVADEKVPDGIDAEHLAVARRALLRKQAGEVAATWPWLATSVGPGWTASFPAWALGRASHGSLRDGWDLARDLATAGQLGPLGREELAIREVSWRYDGRTAPRRRRLPALRRVPGGVVTQVAGRVHRLCRRVNDHAERLSAASHRWHRHR